jgi:hypothetical protein
VSRCVFYVAVIGGRHFEGILSGDGPYITCGDDGVALGTCASIEQLSAEIESGLRRRPVMPHSWWIAKYRNQPRISLDGMTDPERRRTADEFGIRVGRESPDVEPFWESAAFRSLAAWIRSRPRVGERFRDYNAYLPGWYDAACAVVANELP